MLEPQWKKGFRYKKIAAADAVKELKRIETAGGGLLDTHAVVAAATPEDHILHPLFTWDDTQAAGYWRAHQARLVINHLVIVDTETKEEKAPAFINVRVEIDDEKTQSYMKIEAIAESKLLYRQALADALARLASWQQRYKHLKELQEVFAAAEETQKRLAS